MGALHTVAASHGQKPNGGHSAFGVTTAGQTVIAWILYFTLGLSKIDNTSTYYTMGVLGVIHII